MGQIKNIKLHIVTDIKCFSTHLEKHEGFSGLSRSHWIESRSRRVQPIKGTVTFPKTTCAIASNASSCTSLRKKRLCSKPPGYFPNMVGGRKTSRDSPAGWLATTFVRIS